MNKVQSIIENNFRKHFNKPINCIEKLKQSGSNRLYFRIRFDSGTVIATYNNDFQENEAFVYFQQFFYNQHLSVPQLYAYVPDEGIYFQEDLGDITLYEQLNEIKRNENDLLIKYGQVLHDLIQFQLSAQKGLDFSKCYPARTFDETTLRWDLNYFKYMFLRLSYASFHEQKLEDDFNKLIYDLLKADDNYFVYRDFQSRNIMLFNGKCYYIDFQGGRKGSIWYDVASLLYDAKAELTFEQREQFFQTYIQLLPKQIFQQLKTSYADEYYSYVLFRILQALGAYGYRGIYEQKEHFLKSIKPALNNLHYLSEQTHLSRSYPYLMKVVLAQQNNDFFNQYYYHKSHSNKLVLHINSFSYKNGYPPDNTVHAGGYVFDCRALPNPGKDDKLKYFTGKDNEIKQYMQQYAEVNSFLQNVFKIVDATIERYLERDFEYLSVSFGCTGGQHRSVYCAEQLANHVTEKYNIQVVLTHTNKDNWITS
ncbi:MAG: phosphotransferase [Bacteroidales bacterium]|nr:phosphotransferase [Bacteroidales bacterium]